MGKYAEALGIWTLKITDEISFDLKPKKGDNLKLLRLIQESQKAQDNVKLLEQIKNMVVNLINRDHPHNEEDKEELDTLIELNINDILTNLLIGFRLTTKEELTKQQKKLEADETKKSESPAQEKS